MKYRHKQLLNQHFIHKSNKGCLNIGFFLAEVKQEGSGMKDIGPVGWRASQSMGATAGPLIFSRRVSVSCAETHMGRRAVVAGARVAAAVPDVGTFVRGTGLRYRACGCSCEKWVPFQTYQEEI